MTERGLIITADDFGAAAEVNEAVAIGYTQGVLTAASLMVGAEHATDAIRLARSLPGLRVGLHLVLVEGRPVLPADQSPDLVDAQGRFRDDMVGAGARMFFDPNARRQLAAEIAAQFRAFEETGLELDHVNAHKHFHLHPTIGALLLRIGARHGMRAARIPIEPAAALRAVEPHGEQPATAVMLELWARRARQNFRSAGVLTPDQVFGLRWSGAMTADRLRGLIENLPPGLSEIYLHPAVSDEFASAAPGYRYREELAALTAPQVAATVRRLALRTGGFGDFARRPVGAS